MRLQCGPVSFPPLSHTGGETAQGGPEHVERFEGGCVVHACSQSQAVLSPCACSPAQSSSFLEVAQEKMYVLVRSRESRDGPASIHTHRLSTILVKAHHHHPLWWKYRIVID